VRVRQRDRAELASLPEIPFWRHYRCALGICIGSKCPSFDPCFITRARQASLEADIVIVKSSLVLCRLALRGASGGRPSDYTAVIFR